MFSDKIEINFSICLHGRTHNFSAEYDESEQWTDILEDIVGVLESSYGYSFDLKDLGIYYRGKDDGSK